jgi:hypothetical protein
MRHYQMRALVKWLLLASPVEIERQGPSTREVYAELARILDNQTRFAATVGEQHRDDHATFKRRLDELLA